MFTFYYRAKNFCVQDGATIEKPTQGSDIAVRIYELEVYGCMGVWIGLGRKILT